ncbi:MAG TPA: hypothetical protein VLX68_02100 [Chitinivibrionales bacterium]|nr:hypothetical protein [Chitinivibrionales bacterium]
MRNARAPSIGLLAVVIVSIHGAFFPAQSSTIKIKTGSPKSALESYVITDAVGFMSRMFSDTIDTSGAGASFHIIIGTPSNNALVSQQVSGGGISLPAGKNASQGYAIKTVGGAIYLAAATDTGISAAVYDFLEQYGAYFLISGEILPPQTAFTIKNLSVTATPAFRYRGLLPWDNFLCGMSGWNEEDFRLFIDRMVRMRMNFLEFHFYPGMAYYNETYSDGSSATSDHVADWQNSFQPSQIVGGGAFGSITTFGTRQWWQNQAKGAAVQSDSCQAMLRRVIDYARSRGLSTVAGFCLMQPRGGTFTMTNTRGWDPMPDPLVAHNADLEVDRFHRLEQIYPNSDYYWMWQAEAGGALWKTVTNDASATAMRNQYSYWVTDANKKGDIDYGYLFLQTVNKLTSAERSRIATGGWDMSELFNGYDRDCPKEIIFHGMNSWDTRGGISEAANDYTFAKNGRRGWMTDWWEYDGLVWFPEFRVMKQETMYKSCAANAVECVTLDGWKQSGVEHNIRYLAEFAWNPALTGAQFYNEYCQKLYGAQALPVMANFYQVNDSVEASIPAATTGDYRDMNISEGWQPLQLSPYATDLNAASWTTVVSECQTLITKQQALIARDQAFSASLKSLRFQLSAAQQYWLDLIINRLDFRVLYVEALVDINESYVTCNTVGKASGLVQGKTAACGDLNNALTLMYQSILKLAECARNMSDLGLIGQINILDYSILKQFIISNGGTVGTAGNPLRSYLTNAARPGKTEVIVYGIDGRVVARMNSVVSTCAMPLKRAGVYFFKVKNSSGDVTIVKKLVINSFGKSESKW